MSNNSINNSIGLPMEIGLLQQIVNKDSVVMDIGANIGIYTVFLANLAEHVYAFEPAPDNFKQLQQNTKHLDNVDLFDHAVTNDIGFEYLHICPQDPGMNRLYESKWCEEGNKVLVSTSTLDFWMDYIIGKISFIKIDVEGYEYYTVMGAEQLLKRDHPTIMMEWHPPSLEEAWTDPRELYHFMKDELGYGNPKHCLLPGYPVINTYYELEDYTRNIPAINIIWGY